MTSKVKIYGLHRAGTNVTRVLLEKNFDVQVLMNGYQTREDQDAYCELDIHTEGWKHSVPPIQVPDIPHVLCIRDPFSWVQSLHRWWTKSGYVVSSLEEFIRAPSAEFQNPILRWNFLHRIWLLLNPIVVRHSDLQTSGGQQETLDRVREELGVSLLSTYSLVSQEIGMGGSVIGPRPIREPSKLSNSDELFICRNLDWGLVEYLDIGEACQHSCN